MRFIGPHAVLKDSVIYSLCCTQSNTTDGRFFGPCILSPVHSDPYAFIPDILSRAHRMIDLAAPGKICWGSALTRSRWGSMRTWRAPTATP